MSETSPLQRCLAELSRFLVSEHTLSELLGRVSMLAVEAVPSASFAGLTMLVDEQVTTQAFTDSTCPEIDRAQYESGRGPCLQAFRQGSTVIVPSLRSDRRWPEFASAAMAHGVRSTLSVPVVAGAESLGALNFYAHSEQAFDSEAADIAGVFAGQAAIVLVNAQAYWGSRLKSENLEAAMLSRAEIEMAKGIIMNATGCSPDDAFARLREQSQRENRKLREIAAEIVARTQRPR